MISANERVTPPTVAKERGARGLGVPCRQSLPEEGIASAATRCCAEVAGEGNFCEGRRPDWGSRLSILQSGTWTAVPGLPLGPRSAIHFSMPVVYRAVNESVPMAIQGGIISTGLPVT